jgi:excinuclease ABC subunit B
MMPGGTTGTEMGKAYFEPDTPDVAADPVVAYMTPHALEMAIEKVKKSMQAASKELDFISAAQYRDEMYRLQALLKEKEKSEKKIDQRKR